MASETSRERFWQQLKSSRIPETLYSAGDGDMQLSIRTGDDEIALSRAYTQELSARRNALLSVSRFPPELLASIFHFLLPVVETRHQEASERPLVVNLGIAAATRSLIAASHVCQQWREVALEFSSLWTVLWTANKFWLPEMIARAKDSPLVILQLHNKEDESFLFVPRQSTQMAVTPNPRENIDFLMPLLFETKQPRYLCLQLALTVEALPNFCASLLSRPAPCLEVLKVSITVLSHDLFPVIIPANFLGGKAPALRSLSLKGPFSHEVLWTTPVLRGLVNLTLALTPIGQAHNVSLDVTLNALRDMQQLETLHIEFQPFNIASPRQPSYFLSNPSQEGIEVRLPRLSLLSIKGSVVDTTTLTKYLSIAPGAEIWCKVLLFEEDIGPQLAGHLSALLHPVLPIQSTMETYEILFSYIPSVTLHIRCWERTLPLDQHLDKYPVSPRLTMIFSICVADIPGVILQPPDPADIMSRCTRTLVDVLNVLSPLLPRDQPHDLRWGVVNVNDRRLFVSSLLINDDSVLSEVVNTFPETRRLIFDNRNSCKDVLSGAASDSTLLRHLKSIHFIGRSYPDHMPHGMWPPVPPNGDALQQLYQELATDLRRMAVTRDIHTLEWRGGLADDKYGHLFEGIARELVWSKDL